ncbi:hypothetical protein [Pontibacter sp. 172403-2]|uniref:hypothetical protein n=1 Tax=Pontibacter rufus TaxID=2791028 RepID=UPI001E36625F|nr:hypothetical protein [Pontibacter sp. 172403-2]
MQLDDITIRTSLKPGDIGYVIYGMVPFTSTNAAMALRLKVTLPRGCTSSTAGIIRNWTGFGWQNINIKW